MSAVDLEAAARAAQAAADRARREIVARFRTVETETKADGSPVTEADRAAERAIREVLTAAFPDHAILGEEMGFDAPARANTGAGANAGRQEVGPTAPNEPPPPQGGDRKSPPRSEPQASEGPVWVVDPIDGTIAFSRGIPLASTLIALVEDGEPVLGLIDLPFLEERYVAVRGGGARRNGQPVRCSAETELRRALVSHGDPFCFTLCGEEAAWQRMSREIPLLRGYTDAFGHAQVVGGGVDAMVDLALNRWDAAATQVLVPEAGGACVTLDYPETGKLGLVLGSPALVEVLAGFLEARRA